MAIIMLEPGEVFEHYHSQPSSTTLINGSVDLFLSGEWHKLKPGRTIPIPANTPHLLRNSGVDEAKINCPRHVNPP